jgi:protease-4
MLFGIAAAVFFLLMYASAKWSGTGSFGQGRIGLVRIEGVILDAKETLDQLKEYREDPSIQAVLLRIDSPGGAVVPSQEIYDQVRKIREEGKKKVVASMGTVAASGGYYIASGSDRIVASSGTLTGSIGVIMELMNMEGLLKKVGVESVVIKSGKHKDLASPFRKMGEKEREILQGVLDDVHAQFIEAVASGRGMDPEAVRRIADGRVFTGRQAKEIGLVDEVGGLEDAIQAAADLAGIEGKPEVVEREKPFRFLDLLNSRATTGWSALLSLGRETLPIPETGIRINYLMSF